MSRPMPVAPSIRGQMASYMALADPRCSWPEHDELIRTGHCMKCHKEIGEYVRALDVVTWP